MALSSHEADKQCTLLHPSCFYMKIRYLMAVNKDPGLQQVTVNAVTNLEDSPAERMWLLAVGCSSVALVRLCCISLLQLLLVLSLTASSSQRLRPATPYSTTVSQDARRTVRKAKF